MKTSLRLLCLILVLASLFSLAGCGAGQQQPVGDPRAVFQALVTQIQFDTEIADVGDSGTIYFPELPEGATVQMYTGSGYYSDKVALITLAKESDQDAALKAVKSHLSQLRTQFQSYIPEEVPKIDDAVIWQQGNALILCISPDEAAVQNILNNAASLEYVGPATEPPTEPPTEAPTQEVTQLPTEPVTEAPTDPPAPVYPSLISDSGTYAFHNPIYQVDNMGFEGFAWSEPAAEAYAQVINKYAETLAGKTQVYSLLIPTSIGVVLPDDIPAKMEKYNEQGSRISQLYGLMRDDIITVPVWERLMEHRDEYIYYLTDHHWTALGAYYAYETFCEAKGVEPYTLDQREMLTLTELYRGSLYQYMDFSVVGDTRDTITAWKPASQNVSMTITESSGASLKWPVINKDNKTYGTFAGGDNPYTYFENPSVTDGSVCIVVKESFGCAFMPFIVDNYSQVYEIDYRYWKGSLTALAEQVGADDIIFANNMMRICSGLVAGDLDRIF